MNPQMIKALAFLGVLFLASCGNALNAEKIEETILSGLTQQGGSNVKSVICPTNVTPKAGGEFECVGVLDSGNGFAIVVTQQDDQGNVLWKVPSVKGLLNMASLQTEFEQALQKETGTVKIDCGLNPYRIVKPGETFECQLTKRDKKSNSDAIEKTVPTTQISTTQPKKPTVPAASVPTPSDSIQVTIQPSGDVNWQRIIKVPDTKIATATPIDKSTDQKITEKPTQESKAEPAKAAPPAAKSAEDFLNQPGATDDFE